MDEIKKVHVDGGDKEILYSKAIKAGKRIYYLDVKKNLRDDLFLAITESKKIQPRDGSQVSFEKHKIFLYKEDFEKFMSGMEEVINYIRQRNHTNNADNPSAASNENHSDESGEIKLNIEF